MQKIQISGRTGQSKIYIGARLEELQNFIEAEKAVIITDETVWKLHGRKFPSDPVIRIGCGERIKNLDTVRFIYEKLLEMEVDRSVFLIGIGGGIVCDLAGFAASTYLRGLRCGYVATTLLAQVDVSVGGKTGVNFKGYKNLVGTFSQPEFVVCDFELLKTLPAKEIDCGLAEVVKHALIKDADLFDYLENSYADLRCLKPEAVQRIVFECVRIKSDIVNQDERESGLRRILNFGHTFGHAIEKRFTFSHGEAVSMGMVLAAKISLRKGLLEPAEFERIKRLLANLNLPLHLNADSSQLLDAVRKDKKREAAAVQFVLLHGIGQAVVEPLSLAQLEQLVSDRTD